MRNARRRDRTLGQRERLPATDRRVEREEFAVPRRVEPVDAERNAVPFAVRTAAFREISDQEVRFVERVRILEQFADLPVSVDSLRRGFANRGDQRRALVFLRPLRTVDHHQLAVLVGVVPGRDRDHLAGSRNAASVHHRRREIGVVPVKFRLAGAVDVHREERLRVNLPAVVVIPTGVNDATVLDDLRVVDRYLVDRNAAEEAALRVARVKVRNLRPPAVGDLRATGRAEEEIAVREVNRLNVGDAETERDLTRLFRFNIVFVEVEIVFREALAHRENDSFAVPRDVGVANRAVRRRNENLVFERSVRLEGREAKLAARFAVDAEVEVGFVGNVFGVGVMARADNVMLRVNERRRVFDDDRQTTSAAGLADVGVKFAPTRVGSVRGVGGQVDEARAELFDRRFRTGRGDKFVFFVKIGVFFERGQEAVDEFALFRIAFFVDEEPRRGVLRVLRQPILEEARLELGGVETPIGLRAVRRNGPATE